MAPTPPAGDVRVRSEQNQEQNMSRALNSVMQAATYAEGAPTNASLYRVDQHAAGKSEGPARTHGLLMSQAAQKDLLSFEN